MSRYFGKAAVVLFYAIVCAILLFGGKMSVFGVNLLCAVAALCAAGALVMYYFNYLKKKKNRNAGESDAGEGAISDDTLEFKMPQACGSGIHY